MEKILKNKVFEIVDLTLKILILVKMVKLSMNFFFNSTEMIVVKKQDKNKTTCKMFLI